MNEKPSVIVPPAAPDQPDDSRHYSRRQVVGGAAVGIAGLAAGGLLVPGAATAKPAQTRIAEMTTPAPLVPDYPRPPYPVQSQPWPGLVRDMDPKPDHGETSYQGSGRLAGRRALITGGDSGMGRAAAIAFAREGADIAISYYPTEEPDAQDVATLIRAEGRTAVLLPGNIRDEAVCRKLVADAIAGLGGLDILVNNAARQQLRKSLLDITSEDLRATFETNVFAMVWITQAALPHLPDGAAIINTTSEQAYDPSKDIVDYAMTKAAVMNFTKSMAKQLGPRKIRVNGVAPGPIWTPLQVAGGATPEKQQSFGSDTALGRAGQPAELASIYVQLAAADASYATGQIYGASGGGGQP